MGKDKFYGFKKTVLWHFKKRPTLSRDPERVPNGGSISPKVDTKSLKKLEIDWLDSIVEHNLKLSID